MSAGRKKLFLVEGGPTPTQAVADSLRQLYDVEVVPLDRAAKALHEPDGQAVFAEGISPEAAGRLFAPQAQRVMEAIGEGVCVYRSGEGVTWANQRFAALDEQTRQRAAEACEEGARQLLEMRSGVQADSLPKSDSDHGVRFMIEESNGEHYYEVLVSPIEAFEDGGLLVVGVLWDVTESTRTELKLDAIDRAGAELVRLDAEVVRRLNSAERLKLLEEKIVRYAHERLEFDHFTIHLLNKESRRLELVMSEGLPPEVQEVDLYAKREGNGIVGYVAATGRSYLCQRTSADEKYIQGLVAARSSLTVPLLMHDEVIGVFNVESDRVNAFTEADRQFAEMFARYVALAFHILDLLVVERYTTGETVSSTMEGEISEPLEDLQHEAEWLQELAARDPGAAEHAERILRDIESIRNRVSDVRRGPRSILGVEQALKEPSIDPLLANRRVLVVDDEPGIRETIGDILQRRGAIVEIYEKGDDAIQGIEAAFAEGGAGFDLIISDIKLPDRTGYEIFSTAKRVKPNLCVILMTGFGYDPHHSIVRASQDGLQSVLFKPFRAQRLLDEVRRAFSQDATGAPPVDGAPPAG